jgi:integrase
MPSTANRRLVKTATPGIYKRGERYVVVFRDQTGSQKKRHASTLAEARALKAACVADVKRGEYRAVSKVTFSDFAPEWIGSYTGRTKRGIGGRTLAMYRADLGLDADGVPTGGGAIAFFGKMPLAQIGPGDIKRYAAKLSRDGRARSSVRRGLAPVKALLADAHEDGLIRFNPTAGVRIVAPLRDDEESVEKVKALTPDHLSAVIEHTPDEWQLFFMFLAETGLRIGEAIEARWDDIDRGNRRLNVARQWHRGEVSMPKGRKTRTVPLSALLDGMLWELRKRTRAQGHELIFVGEEGARVNQGNLSARVLKPTCKAAGVGGWPTWHTFRHTCASQLFRNGWNAAQVSRFLGHADAGFTLRTYVHLLDADLPEPNVLDSLTGGNSWGNNGATEPPEDARNAVEETKAPIALVMPDRGNTPNRAEIADLDYESAALTS